MQNNPLLLHCPVQTAATNDANQESVGQPCRQHLAWERKRQPKGCVENVTTNQLSAGLPHALLAASTDAACTKLRDKL